MDRRPLIPALTGIRFLAALAVIVFHLQMVVVYPAFLLLLVNQGRLGVDVFFVLSGFVMTYTYDTSIARGRISYRDFLQARFARV
ncbi:MAG TPA: acyltransferase family protein, partial [Chloroflexota bacterium]|nr:acyltransferase family protein [Chloroflexota bacterium]